MKIWFGSATYPNGTEIQFKERTDNIVEVKMFSDKRLQAVGVIVLVGLSVGALAYAPAVAMGSAAIASSVVSVASYIGSQSLLLLQSVGRPRIMTAVMRYTGKGVQVVMPYVIKTGSFIAYETYAFAIDYPQLATAVKRGLIVLGGAFLVDTQLNISGKVSGVVQGAYEETRKIVGDFGGGLLVLTALGFGAVIVNRVTEK